MTKEELPKTVEIGGIEFSQMQASELMNTFDSPGWQHFKRIMARHNQEQVDTLLGTTRQATLQEVGLAQGTYLLVHMLENLPEDVVVAYRDTFLSKIVDKRS